MLNIMCQADERVHEMNAEITLQVFLPYHDSPNFARILAILSIPSESAYHAPFAPLVKKPQPVAREYITSAISSARDPSLRLLTDLAESLKIAHTEGCTHRALLAFWSATLVDLLERSRSTGRVPEGVVKILVEAFVTLLSTPGVSAEVNAAVYPPLVLLTRSVRLADAPFAAIVEALLTPSTGASPSQRVLTLLALLDARKGWDQGLGADAPARLDTIPQLGDLLVAAMEKYGFENAMQVIVSVLIDDVPVSLDTLTRLVDYPALAESVVKVAAEKLLNTPSGAHKEARDLLSTLRQRHPSLIDGAVLEASATSDVDPALIQWSSAETAFLDVHSADVASRVSGVREMYAVADAAGLNRSNAAELIASDDKLRSAQNAIIARLRDSDVEVLSAVYAEPELLLCLLTGADYIDAVLSSFNAVKPQPKVIGLHIDFLAHTFLPAHHEADARVFEKLLIPNLLATEDRRAFGPEQWPSVIKACRLVAHTKIPALDASVEQLIKFNQELIKATANAIASSGDIGSRVDLLVSALSASGVSARLFAAITLGQLVSCAGGYQHAVAARSLDALQTSLGGKALVDVDSVESPLSEPLIKAIVTKHNQSRTLQRASLALLSAAAGVRSSPNDIITWLGDDSNIESTEAQARRVAHSLYRWANSASLAPSVAKSLLQSVLSQLGEDALVFFASIWTNAADSGLRVAALRHAAAFIKAYQDTDKKKTDFQLIVPALLIALQDPLREVRAAAAAILKSVSESPTSGSSDIYGLETIYGQRSDLVQLLKPSDLSKYLESLAEALDDMVLDASRLALVHGSVLDASTRDGKKNISQRRAVVDSLMSHVLGWRADEARRSLLSSLARVTNVSRLQGALPLLEPLEDVTKDEADWLESIPAAHRSEYLDLLFEGFNPRHASVVTESDSEAWRFLLDLFTTKPTPIVNHMRSLSLERMGDGLFLALKPTQRAEYVVDLVQSLHGLSVEDKIATKAVLAKLRLSTLEINGVIETLLEPLESTVQRKKVKNDDAEDKMEQAVYSITSFIESRDWSALRGDASLVAALMSILSAVLTKRQSIKEGVDYLEQEVLGAILAQLERINDASEILRARVGIEVIVKVIRASSNPRTSQRALLVASELARLVPESVLHNVMPIFTFMGSSDLQRDDAYSFGVVEQTVSRIVPVMAESLKERATTALELYTEARSFLNIFTDMAGPGRLPKHRTLPFFVHLVKSLGAESFLAPVCMLLATGKKMPGLDLPLSLAQAFPASVRTHALLEIEREATRLVSGTEEGFLADEKNNARHAATLLELSADLAKQLRGKMCPQPAVEEIVRDLVSLGAETMDSDAQLAEPLEAALANAMQLLSVPSFLGIVEKILDTGREEDIIRSLDMFTERLPLIKIDVRAKSSAAIGKIIKGAASLLKAGQDVASHAIIALEAITASALNNEDNALASIVPTAIEAVKGADAETAVSSMSLTASLVRRLGPRSIPFIQPILDACLSLASQTGAAIDAAFLTISALVDTVPTFITGKQLVSLLRATAEHRADDEGASAVLIAAVAKRIPTKTLIPVVMDLWKELKGAGQAPIEAFFALLKHALRHADRSVLPGLTKPLFAFFLDVFDLRHGSKLPSSAVDAVETSSIASFIELVTKLSEASFKPLFVRLYDWAVVDLQKPVNDAHVVARRTVLFRVMSGLLDKFRHLLTGYMGTLLPLVDELLSAYQKREITDAGLWALMLDTLAKSFDVDEGAFWTDAALLKLLPGLVAQLSTLPELASSEVSPPARALAALAAATNGETTLRKINMAVCMVTRAEEPRTRMAALRALEAMWERHADEMIPLVPETVAEFLAELLEDENSEVEGLARKVLARIEGVTGSLKEYLE